LLRRDVLSSSRSVSTDFLFFSFEKRDEKRRRDTGEVAREERKELKIWSENELR